MKRTLAILVPAMLFSAPLVHADAIDCFPLCAPAIEPAQEAPKPSLCEHRAVREVARIDRDLKPVKELVSIATNPTGFAMKLVNDHVVRIPPWVGIAMDPRGYARAKVVDRVRQEAKKAMGVERDCAEEIAHEDARAQG